MNLREFRAAFARGEARGVESGAAFRAAVAERIDDAREEREAKIRAEAYAAGRSAGYHAGQRDAQAGIKQALANAREMAERDASDRARYGGRVEAWHAMASKLRKQVDGVRGIEAAAPIAATLDGLRMWVENEREVSAKQARGYAPEPCEVVPIRRR